MVSGFRRFQKVPNIKKPHLSEETQVRLFVFHAYSFNNPQGACSNALKRLDLAFASSIICAKIRIYLRISEKNSNFAVGITILIHFTIER